MNHTKTVNNSHANPDFFGWFLINSSYFLDNLFDKFEKKILKMRSIQTPTYKVNYFFRISF